MFQFAVEASKQSIADKCECASQDFSIAAVFFSVKGAIYMSKFEWDMKYQVIVVNVLSAKNRTNPIDNNLHSACVSSPALGLDSDTSSFRNAKPLFPNDIFSSYTTVFWYILNTQDAFIVKTLHSLPLNRYPCLQKFQTQKLCMHRVHSCTKSMVTMVVIQYK